MIGQSPRIQLRSTTHETTMKVQYSTRVRAPANDLPQSPPGLHDAEQHDVPSPNPIGRNDALPTAGGTPSRAPIGRDGTNRPEERPALLSTKCTVGIGTWNVRTLNQEGGLEILLHQLSNFSCEILGVSETHWTETGDFTKDGYKVLCSSRDDIHRQGVALILNKSAQKALLGYNPVSPRLISARFQTQIGTATIIQIYAPNTADPDTLVDDFYDDLQQAVNITPSSDFLILMGDFNAKVGTDTQNWEGVLGKFGFGECNERGEKLLNFCTTNGLFLANTCFKQSKTSREWTWESPDGVYHNKIDYIIVNRKMRSSITNARSFPSADVGSDHQLVLANIKPKLKAKKKPTQVMKRFNVSKLKSPDTKHKFEITIGGKFEVLLKEPDTNLDVNDTWNCIKEAFHTTSEEVLGPQRAQPQAMWMTQDILELTDQRSKLKVETLSDPARKPEYNYLTREIKRKCKERKEEWINDVRKDIDKSYQSQKSKEAYSAIKKLTKKPSTRMQSVKTKDGNILTEEEDVKKQMERKLSGTVQY